MAHLLNPTTLTGLRLDGLDQAMDKAIAYVKRCQDRTGKFAYKERSSGKASLTGAGVLCLQLWKNAKSEEAKKGLEWIVNNQVHNGDIYEGKLVGGYFFWVGP